MKIGHPIRDLAEGQDGRIALLFDGGHVGVLAPVAADAGAVDSGNDSDLGQLLLNQCKACHPIEDGTVHGIGPDLAGVVGRRVASAVGYNYSPALKELSGRWTRDRLDAFLADPSAYAPGTAMETDVLPDENERKKLIDFLAKD
jgi:cytochrome c